MTWLVSVIVIFYLANLVNGCWSLVEAIRKELTGIDEKTGKISTSHSLDSATNLPSYQ
jgi:hypothetical protein